MTDWTPTPALQSCLQKGHETVQHQHQYMGELHRRTPDLAPCCQSGHTKRQKPSLKREPRGRKGNDSLSSHHLSHAAVMQQRLTLPCQAAQPLAKVQIDPTTWIVQNHLLKTEGCRQ